MNATRAASIRLRAAFDGIVSLGRVQTPTLALVARREEEIRAFKPEPYWLVEARLRRRRRAPLRRPLPGRQADRRARGHRRSSRPSRPASGEITKLEKKEERERSQLLYDLTSLQRHANTRFGFSARRTLGAAQKLYEQHKAITYPRTNSRWLSSDLITEIRPTAELVGQEPRVREGRGVRARRSKELPLGRVVNDKKVEDHHAIIPTQSEHDLGRMRDGREEGLRPGRQALPLDLPPRRGVRAHARRDHRRRARLPHQRPACCSRRAGARCTARRPIAPDAADDDSGGDQMLPKLAQGERVETRRSSRCARRRSRRGASRRPRCSARWRPPARTSRTPSCARR